MPLRLFLGDLMLGEVEPIDADFPAALGRYRPSGAGDRPGARRRVADYAASWAEADRILSEDGDGAAWEARVVAHDARFLDLIGSRDWWLEDDRGGRSAILVPTFGGESTIAWRRDFDREGPAPGCPGPIQ